MYRKRLSAKQMGQPATTFLGMVVVELEGRAVDYDSAAPDDAPAQIALGTEARSDAEVKRFADKKVVVTGTLAIDPSRYQPPPRGAAMRPKPTLLDPHDVELAK